MNRVVRAIDVGLALLFALSAAVQVNDPDPARWIAIYAAAMSTCALAPRLPGPAIPAGIGAIALVWALGLTPGVLAEASWGDLIDTMKHDNHAEEARELGGLALVVAAMAYVIASRAVLARRSLADRDG